MKHKKRVLIVEDEKPIASALNELLNNEGVKAQVASDGVQALKTLEKQSFDLILLDILMPGLGGYDVLNIIHLEHPKTKVIVISNLSREEEINRAKQLGADEYIVKSDMSLKDVVKRVKKQLNS